MKIELETNYFVNGLPYKAGIWNLSEGIVKQFNPKDYKILGKSKKKGKKTSRKTKEMRVNDKPTGYSDKIITAKDFGANKE